MTCLHTNRVQTFFCKKDKFPKFIILILLVSFYSFNLYSNSRLTKVLKVRGNKAVLLLPKNYEVQKGELLKLKNNSYGKVISYRHKKALVLLFNDHQIKLGDIFPLPELTQKNLFDLDGRNTPSQEKSFQAGNFFFRKYVKNTVNLGLGINFYKGGLKSSDNAFSLNSSNHKKTNFLFTLGIKINDMLTGNFIYNNFVFFSESDKGGIAIGIYSGQIEFNWYIHSRINLYPFVGVSIFSHQESLSIVMGYVGAGIELFLTKQISISAFGSYGRKSYKVKSRTFDNDRNASKTETTVINLYRTGLQTTFYF